MSEQLRASIVRIHDKNGRVVGTGFLATEKKILTCAHVVTQALGIPENTPKQPVNEIYLDFPLIARKETLTARVVLWRPIGTSPKEEEDIAVLKLEQDALPSAQFVCLVKSDELWGHAFRVLGFPAGYDDGTWASGILRDKTATGWIQIEDIKETGYRIQPGFSGAPIWDEQLNSVVGMIVAAERQPGVRAAFMIPANLLINVWPMLWRCSLNVNDLAYLQEQLAAFEAAQQNAPDPRRFHAKINELQTAIANWEGRVEKQRQRIADGLTEQRQLGEERSKQGLEEKRLRVIGRRPLGEVEYFKNRQREQNKIGQLLAEPTTRLVSVIGHGGMGKTALASKVLRDLEHYQWPHTDDKVPLNGIVYLSTRTAGISLERVFLDCAKMLGGQIEKRLNTVWTNPGMRTEDKISHLLKALRDGLYIILLDNIEDLLDDKGQLEDKDLQRFFDQSLTTAHGARLLVTSRLSLAFRREVMRFDQQVKLLEGLPVPDGVALLCELDPNGDYGLQAAPEEQLAQAVSLVHGVPRALEVIAGILANDPFISLEDVLEKFFEQEDVVHALIEENYRRLDDKARKVIEALAVFKRPVPPLAVDYLLEPFIPGLNISGIIQRLTHTNIVSVDRATKTITLHPIDQDYAYNQLPEEGTSELAYTRQALERRAADYYVQLCTPPETWKTIDDLEPQLVEFEHRVRAGDYDDAYRVLEPIYFGYLYLWGYYARLVHMQEKLLDHLTNPSLQAANLNNLGLVYHGMGEFKRAIKSYKQSLTIFRKIDDRRNEGRCLGNLGRACRNQGQIGQAVDFYEQSLIIAQEIDDQWSKEIQHGNLGSAYHELGQITQAIKLHEEALAIARNLKDRRGESVRLADLGNAYLDLGQVEQAINLHREALKIAQEINYRRGEDNQLGYLGNAYIMLRQFEQAIDLYKDALNIAREIGHRRGESYQLLGLGRTLMSIGSLSEARLHCKKAWDLDIPETRYQAVLALAIVLLHQRDPYSAATFEKAVTRCQAMLDKTTNLYKARYALATAFVGQAVCNPNWTKESERAGLLAPTLEEYERALKNCNAPGVVRDAIRDMELIRAAGIEGLEPVFELLEKEIKIVEEAQE